MCCTKQVLLKYHPSLHQRIFFFEDSPEPISPTEKFSTPRRLDAPTVNDVNLSSSSGNAVRPCRDLGPLRRQDFRSPLNLPSPFSDRREEKSEGRRRGGCGISELRSYQYLNAHLVQSLSRNRCET